MEESSSQSPDQKAAFSFKDPPHRRLPQLRRKFRRVSCKITSGFYRKRRWDLVSYTSCDNAEHSTYIILEGDGGRAPKSTVNTGEPMAASGDKSYHLISKLKGGNTAAYPSSRMSFPATYSGRSARKSIMSRLHSQSLNPPHEEKITDTVRNRPDGQMGVPS